MPISAQSHETKSVEVKGRRMAYVEMGDGAPIVLQHGNPTSSYLWRNIMPHLAKLGRCVAVDLIGMGESDKLPGSGPESYTYLEHRDHLFAAWEALGITEDVVMVLHDWGGALGFDWAFQNQDAVQGLAYMETIVAPVPRWEDWPDSARGIFQAMRSEAGEEMVLEKNVFVERILPASILRELTDEEMSVYRAPYLDPGESRRPTLTWPRQIPIEGEPADVTEIVKRYSDWLATSDIPKLFIDADPGTILTGPLRDLCRAWPNQTEITAPGLHFIQEDSPDRIGAALAGFVEGLR